MAQEVNTILSPRRPQLREIAIAAALADLGVFLWCITGLMQRSTMEFFFGDHSHGFWLLPLSTTGAIFGLLQFAKERSIVRHCGTAVGEVVGYKGIDTDAIPVQRHYYSINTIRYRFATKDGMFYHGVSGTKRVPTEPGVAIEIIYDRRNPAINMPRERIWFYTKPVMPVAEAQC